MSFFLNIYGRYSWVREDIKIPIYKYILKHKMNYEAIFKFFLLKILNFMV